MNDYQHQWAKIVAQNPAHSANYARRWDDLAAAGNDINGEARLIDAMVSRNARILDAGCGTGRVGGYLAAQGHQVNGIDLDPVLIRHAQESFPQSRWFVGDLAVLDDPAHHPADWDPTLRFDAIVSAGNVLPFLDPASRGRAVANLTALLAEGGRLVCGFGVGRGYDFAEFFTHLSQAGLTRQQVFSSWELQPFSENSDFIVAIAQP